MLLFLALLLFPVPSTACPDLTGVYSDRDLFLETLAQTGCERLVWRGEAHPANPSPPGTPPDTTTYAIDCLKHGSLFQMDAVCWNADVLEMWTYSKNAHGVWVPFSIRKLYLDAEGNLRDDAYLTDASGDSRPYLQTRYRRVTPRPSAAKP